jgi:hypothetical protein
MFKTNTESNSQQVLLGYTEVTLTGLTDTHTSYLGSTGKLRLHLVGKLEKSVNS